MGSRTFFSKDFRGLCSGRLGNPNIGFIDERILDCPIVQGFDSSVGIYQVTPQGC